MGKMSDYTRRKANKHKVQHEFSGKEHFYDVKSGTSGKKHNVVIKVNCVNCEFMGTVGLARSKICSHILAVMDKISATHSMDFCG